MRQNFNYFFLIFQLTLEDLQFEIKCNHLTNGVDIFPLLHAFILFLLEKVLKASKCVLVGILSKLKYVYRVSQTLWPDHMQMFGIISTYLISYT